MTTITAADIAYARRNNEIRRGYADAWHRAYRAADRASAIEFIPSDVPESLLALASELAGLSLAGASRFIGYDEAFVLYVDGARRLDIRSSLPAHAGSRSSALSLAIELAARLAPGSHEIKIGTISSTPRADRRAAVEVAA